MKTGCSACIKSASSYQFKSAQRLRWLRAFCFGLVGRWCRGAENPCLTCVK
ncbi:hypothetical protein [Acidovorax sp. BL-A-41-H1]|uniref:hypothetical protein n=1 Tax=Acidovorax sp. BL-A-41-H1 TaxID=3421102 RepID=UPI003F7A5010